MVFSIIQYHNHTLFHKKPFFFSIFSDPVSSFKLELLSVTIDCLPFQTFSPNIHCYLMLSMPYGLYPIPILFGVTLYLFLPSRLYFVVLSLLFRLCSLHLISQSSSHIVLVLPSPTPCCSLHPAIPIPTFSHYTLAMHTPSSALHLRLHWHTH